MNRFGSRIKEPMEKCPKCGAEVNLKLDNNFLKLYNSDGKPHICEEFEFEKHPIGQAVCGKIIQNFQLRGRRLTITLNDGNILSVSAAGRPLSIRLEGPTGIIQE